MSYDTFWDVTPQEFFAAWKGYYEEKTEDLNNYFWLAQYNAMRTAFSKKQAEATGRDKSPWLKKRKGSISQKAITNILDRISKNG